MTASNWTMQKYLSISHFLELPLLSFYKALSSYHVNACASTFILFTILLKLQTSEVLKSFLKLARAHCISAAAASASSAWSPRPLCGREKEKPRNWYIIEEEWEAWKKSWDENLYPVDYHLQKYNFMINDSFVPEIFQFFFPFSVALARYPICHWSSCAWNDNSLSFLHILWLCLMSFQRFFPPCRLVSSDWLCKRVKRNLLSAICWTGTKTCAFCDATTSNNSVKYANCRAKLLPAFCGGKVRRWKMFRRCSD